MKQTSIVRTLVAGLICLGAATAPACEGKAKDPGVPDMPPGSGAVAGSGSGSGARTDIPPPVPPATTLKAPTLRVTHAVFEHLAKFQLDGFVLSDQTVIHDDLLNIVMFSAAKPTLRVEVLVTPCPTTCIAMTLPAWQANAADLRQLIPEPLRALPDTEYSLGADSIGGQPAIFMAFSGSIGTAPTGTYGHAYVVYVTDGVNLARVIVSYADGLASKVEMEKAAPMLKMKAIANQGLMNYWNERARP